MWEALTSLDVGFSLWLTAKTVLWACLFFLIIAPPLGFWLARYPSLGVRIVGFIVTLPLVFPPIALGYLLLLVFGKQGILGGYLFEHGIQIIFTPIAVVMAGVIAGLPLVIRPLQAALGSAQLMQLESAARVHGLTRMQTFWRITLPLIRPSLAVGLLMGCARVVGEVGITLMLGGNIEGRTNTLSLAIFNAVGRADYDEANALSVVLVVTAILLFLAMEAILKRSVKL